MYRIVAVEFLNTLPFIEALRNSAYLTKNCIVTTADPKTCAISLFNNTADIALLPVSAIHDFDHLYRLTDYGIASNGEVKTVGIFSNKKWEDIHTICKSSVSRSSNNLLDIINRHFWKLEKKIIEHTDNIIADAQLIIGDEAFNGHKIFQYYYDLSQIWKEKTKLPFVFATWMSRTIIDSNFILELNRAFQNSTSPSELHKIASKFGDRSAEIESYFKNNICYLINPEMIKSMHYFFELNEWKWNIADEF